MKPLALGSSIALTDGFRRKSHWTSRRADRPRLCPLSPDRLPPSLPPPKRSPRHGHWVPHIFRQRSLPSAVGAPLGRADGASRAHCAQLRTNLESQLRKGPNACDAKARCGQIDHLKKIYFYPVCLPSDPTSLIPLDPRLIHECL